jgi:CRISPR-associated protein Csd1
MHAKFKELVETCARETQESTVKAVHHFLDTWTPETIESLVPDFDGSHIVTFRIGNNFPTELVSVQSFWARYTAKADGPEMMCLVTKQVGPVEQRLPGKLKGIPKKTKGEPALKSLVSADKSAFYSYGLENSLTSPISRDAAERFTKGLNDLLGKQESRFYVGSLVYVFWTREPTEFSPGSILSRPTPEQVKQLFASAYSGEETYGLKSNRFYALALSASGGRAVVRDWLETTIPEVQGNLKPAFQGQTIVDVYGQPADYFFGLNRLAEAAFRRSLVDRRFDLAKEVPANVIRMLAHSAYKGSRLPDDLLARLVKRCAVGTEVKKDTREHVKHTQAALLKLIFATRGATMPDAPEPTPELEPNDALAYQCGRLLAELEAIQRAALGQRNATVVDRFYGAAAATPASAFAPLLSNVRVHLGKLRKSKGGAWQAKEEVLEEILGHYKHGLETPRLPATLSVRQQGVFALGFYHQRAYNRAQAKAHSQTASDAVQGGVQ